MSSSNAISTYVLLQSRYVHLQMQDGAAESAPRAAPAFSKPPVPGQGVQTPRWGGTVGRRTDTGGDSDTCIR